MGVNPSPDYLIEFKLPKIGLKEIPNLVFSHKLEFLMGAIIFALILTWGYGESLWWDEGCSVAFAERPLQSIPEDVKLIDIHPPGYYMLLSIWATISTSALWLRMLSLALYLLGGLAVGLLAHDTWKNKRITVTASFLTLVAALSFYEAHEVRMYALLLFGSAWTLFLMERFVRKRSLMTGALLCAFGLLTLITHYYGSVLVVGLVFVYCLIGKGSLKERAVRMAPLILSVAFFAIAWGWGAYYQIEHNVASASLSIFTIPIGVAQVFGYPLRTNMSTADRTAAILLGYLVLILAVMTKPLLKQMFRSVRLQLLVTLVGIFIIAGFLFPGIFNDRFPVVFTPALVLTICEILVVLDKHKSADASSKPGRMRWDRQKTAALGVVILVAVSLFSIWNSHVNSYRNEDWSGMTQFIESHESASDVVLLPRDTSDRIFDFYLFGYYYHGELSYSGIIDNPGTLTQDVANASIDSYCAGHDRAWYVTYASAVWDPQGFMFDALSDHYANHQNYTFGNVGLTLFWG